MTKWHRSLTRLPASGSYDVGYGKPPASTRFRPGQSGNPKGRPKGRKTSTLPALHEERLKDIVLSEAYRTIKVNDGAKQVTVPMAQAIVRSMAVTAAKGNTRSQRLFAELLASTETSNRKLHEEWLETAITYKVEWEKELERRRALNIKASDPIPHPDDVIINLRGKGPPVDIRGPMSKKEQSELIWLLDRKREFEQELADLQTDLTDPECAEYLGLIQKDIAHTSYLITLASRAIDIRANKECVARLVESRKSNT